MQLPTTKYQKFEKLVTAREIEILDLLSRGFSTEDIAGYLYISSETVKSHRRNLLQKVGARNVASLVRIGLEVGIII